MNEEIQSLLGHTHPISIFKDWWTLAKSESYENEMNEATAMTLSTADANGWPSSRVVLLKLLSETGFIFFTSYISKKAREMEMNNRVSLNFYWPQIFRQVKVQGQVCKTSREVSENYWNSRPKGSQISQALSQQSQPIESRLQLEDRHEQLKQQYADKDLTCPSDWGGYEVTPSRIEFWIGQQNRLHDRLVATLENQNWVWQRLQP